MIITNKRTWENLRRLLIFLRQNYRNLKFRSAPNNRETGHYTKKHNVENMLMNANDWDRRRKVRVLIYMSKGK